MKCDTSSSYFYRTQVRSLQSTLVIHSLTNSLLLLWLEWCDSGWWGLLLDASWWSYTWAMLVNSNMMADIWPRFEAAFWLHILLFFFAFHTFLTISYDYFCRADSYPLMTSIWPTAFACIAYVYFCKVPSILFQTEAFSLLSARQDLCIAK